MSHASRPPVPERRQRGMTLLELLIAMAIALFLLGGLLTIVARTKDTYAADTSLAQLEDDERLALTVIGDVIQQAGYFPDPTAVTVTGAFPVDTATFAPGFTTAGQTLYGTTGLTDDTIYVRYLTALNDGVLNCRGGGNDGTVPALQVNRFNLSAGALRCRAYNQPTITLVPAIVNDAGVQVRGLRTMRFAYGVRTNPAGPAGVIDSWVGASDMTAAYWQQVIAVRVTLTFFNPLFGQAGQPQFVTVERVVDVMNQAGIRN